MNTLSYRELKDWYLENDTACQNADIYFKGKRQPSIHGTGFYSAPSWNWGYHLGLVSANGKVFEVVTRFGEVKAAREVNIPELREG